MSSQIAKTKYGYIEYCIEGKGSPIVFIHGGHSNCYETLCHKGFDLNRFQLITPSRPGYGRTPLDNNRTPKQAAHLIAALLDELSLTDVIVYGISAGGLTAIELAGNYPQLVNKLILASAVSQKWLDPKGKVYKTAQRIFSPRMEKLTWGMVRFFARLSPTMIAKSFYPEFSSLPSHSLDEKDVKELIKTMQHYHSGNGFLNDIDQDILNEVKQSIQCPTLIIHSVNDGSVSINQARNTHHLIKHSQLIELNNKWGHLFWIGKDSDESIHHTLKFIQEGETNAKIN